MNPRQICLLQTDAYALLGEILRGESGVVIDGGANVGEATRRMRECFPGADIHAFEPVEAAFGTLAEVSREADAVPHRCAIGDRDGEVRINVNRNLWTCSILDANDRGHAFHDDWCETVATEAVSVVRLDTWAQGVGIDEVVLLKLDLQGFELRALRGAGELLGNVKAIYSEAQIIPEYEGADTFAELDRYLTDHGFRLYQLTDLCLKGRHLEPSCCDAIWLRRDVAERVLASAPSATLMRARDARSTRMAEALDRCAEAGFGSVAVFGAGAHTAACGEALASPPVGIACLVDDARAGSCVWGLPVVTVDDAVSEGIDAVIISSDRAEEAIFERCSAFVEAGKTVVTLYRGGGVAFHGQTMDATKEFAA